MRISDWSSDVCSSDLKTDDLQRRQTHAEELDRRRGLLRCRGENRVERDRVEDEVDGENAQDEAEIADAVDDEGLDRGGVRGRAVVPEADQQIGTEPANQIGRAHV